MAAGSTTDIGLGATYLGEPPASLPAARLWATLDHLTRGARRGTS
jgi:alkanesulfonate monooxygenase SsuD/methylene tetrahydromethanopterin reductase-like flavin-dependent oxidoreductase (luciferase family)